MNKLEGQSYSEIVEELNKRNRRFKLFAVMFMFVSGLALLILIILGINALHRANDQLAQQKQLLETQNQTLTAIKDAADQRTEQLVTISNQLDCIAQFFALRNRQNAVITDLKQCQILTSNGVIDGTPSNLGNGASQAPDTQPNQSNQSAPENEPEPEPEPTGIRRLPLVNRLLEFLGL